MKSSDDLVRVILENTVKWAVNIVSDQSGKSSGRKFEWIDKWVKMTGERAKIDAKANNTYIIYNTENGWVREYPDGTILPHDQE